MLVALTNEVSHYLVVTIRHLVVLVALTNEVSLCLVVTSRALSCVGGTDQ